MTSKLHLAAAAVATGAIATFQIATVAAETLGSRSDIAAVKHAIPLGLVILIPAMAATGATGLRMAGARMGRTLRAKRNRMIAIAANGLLVLTPSALWLDRLAGRGEWGGSF